MKPKYPIHILRASITIALAFGVGQSASAATTVYWDALAGNNSKLDPGNGTWGSSSFWNSSSTGAASPGAWGNNDIASFSVSGTNVITMGTNIGATGITFAAGTTTIGTVGDGKQITLGTTGMGGGGGNGTINTNLVFGGNQDWTLSGGTSVYVYGVISGGYSFTTHNSTGGATFFYNTANTYSGSTNVSQGPLHVAVLADGGSSSSIGNSSNAVGNLIFNRSGGGGTGSTGTASLFIDGTNATGCSTNRLFTITSSTSVQTTAAILNNGSGAVNFTNTGSISMSGAYAHGLQLGGNYTGAVNTFAPVISNYSGSATTSFTKSDAGTWALTGANTYTGTTTISGGTLQIGNGGTIGSLASGTAITDNANLAFDRTDSYGGSYSNAITGSGTLTVLAGTLTLAGTYGNSGGFVINNGATVIMANNNEVSSIPLTVYGTLNFDNGQIFGVLNGSGTITENTNSLYTNSSSNGTFSGAINGNGSYIKQGTGTEILSGTNGFTGGVAIYGGTVQLGSGGALNGTAGLENSVTFGSGTTGTLALGGNSVTVSSLTGSASGPVVENANGTGVSNATLTVGNSTNASGTFAGVIQDGSGGGTLAVTKAGSGTLTLSGTNTYTGGTTVANGTLTVNNISGSGTGSGSVTVNSGATLSGSGSVSGTTGVTGGTVNGSGLTLTGATTFNSTGNTLSGTVTSSAGMSLASSAALALNGALTGNLTVGNGTLTGTGSVSGTTGVTGGTVNGSGLTLTGATTFNSTGNTLSGTVTSSSGVSMASSAALALNGALTGNLTVGNGTLTGTGSVSGTTGVTGGTVNGSGLTLTGATTFNSGSNTLSGTVTSSAGVSLASGAALAVNGALTGNLTVGNGTLTGTGSVSGTTGVTSGTVNGSGLTLTGATTFNSGSNTLSGTVTSSAGVSLASGAALALNGALTGTLAIGSGTVTGTGGSVSGATTLNGGTINLTSGTLSSTLGVTGGNWNGQGTVSGAVTSSSGTFTIGPGANMTASSGLSVSGGTLTGSGTITGNTSIGSGATHAPGGIGTVGTQAIGGDLNYGASSIFAWDLNTSSTSTGFDTVSATGNIDVVSGAVFKVIFGGTAATEVTDMSNVFWNTPGGTQTWNMADIFGQSFNSGSFSTVDTNTDVSTYGAFTINGSTLTWTAVPEPTSALVGLLIGAGMLRRRRVG